ncbi:HAD-IA family hydrolase [uncultured Leifsonia sp.]|uniref:HAD-IA family hydrolase n=1 Tax=uncultured Leifsonia sp. TaxID=340359 RepID=UPI0025E66CB7|nr:HAD-IA family hydrolase [uncultured Leifsonia sp.]
MDNADAYLFDMDGTLVDSHAVVEAVWTEFCQRHGLDPRAVLAFAHGRQAGDTVAHFLPALTDSAQAELVAGLLAAEVARTDGIVEVPGARRLLAALAERGAGVAIVTSASRELALARLNAAGVGVPQVIVAAEDVECGKPDPSCYLLAASRLGAPIERCVVFEDAEAGLAAAIASGARVVVVGSHVSALTDGLERIGDYAGAVPGVEDAPVAS